MTDHSILQALVAQAWQLAALAAVVAVCVRYAARNRPHLAHALWLVVLLKCVTPPVWGSPIGVFSWLSPTVEESTATATGPELIAATPYDASALAVGADGPLGPADVTVNARANRALTLESTLSPDFESVDADDGSLEASGAWLIRAGLIIWGIGVIAMIVVSAIRFAACWRRLRRSQVETYPELELLVVQISKTLRLRRAVRLLVTDSRIGPAVIGLWRPTILLPACVVRGRAAAELEPILAHELIHIRRGDLWVGLLQTVAQALWWFHPLVWLAGRMITREAERCCDEEVIGELRCEPSRYARSLLGVLEWKRILIPAPAVPGVRAVEITSRRLERIMTLGQGCRRRTPWWCWGTMLLVAALALPGSPLRMNATEPEEAAQETKATGKSADGDQNAPRAMPAPRADAAKAAPVTFPEERAGSYNHSARQIDGKPLQVWGMGDLLDTIEKQLGVERAAAKRVLWLRLVNAQLNAEKPQPTQSIVEDSAANSYEKADRPDGEPYWQGDTLVLSQYPPRRKRSEAALAEMRKYGFESVEIEVRFVSGPLNGITDVSDAWTTLPMKSTSDAAAALDSGRSLQANGVPSGVASFAIEKNLPVILDVLDDARAKRLIDNAQGDRRTNVLQAPRVRVDNGRTAAVMDCTQTPFVVGFKDKQPQISVVSEGTTVRARPVLDGNKAHVDFEVVLSGIRSVEEVKVRGPDGVQTTIQSPEVAQSRIAATVDTPLGQTVLIGGLKDVRDPKSKTSMAVLLTVRKAPLDASAQASFAKQPSSGKRDAPSYSILGPITSGGSAKALDPPNQDEVLRAVQKARPASDKTPPVEEKQRKNVRMTIERVATYVDPPRLYPLIGTAQLHHAHYKCTLYYDETTKQGWPVPNTSAKKEAQEVFYVDQNHFHKVDRVDATRAGAKNDAIFTVTYAVADLIIPFPNPVTITANKDARPLPQAKADYDPLVQLITSTVAPESWEENGGPGTVQPYRENLSIVVAQTEKAHIEIATLLKQLRENLDKQVVLDCRTSDDPSELLRLMKSDGKALQQSGLGMLPPDIVAKAHQAAEAKGGRNLKLTVFNGQQLKLPMLQEIGEGKARFLTIQAIISKQDGMGRLRLAHSREGARQPWLQEEMTVLECGSLLIDATKYPFSNEFGVTPPATKEGAKAKPVYVLITPKVIDALGAKKPGP